MPPRSSTTDDQAYLDALDRGDIVDDELLNELRSDTAQPTRPNNRPGNNLAGYNTMPRTRKAKQEKTILKQVMKDVKAQRKKPRKRPNPNALVAGAIETRQPMLAGPMPGAMSLATAEPGGVCKPYWRIQTVEHKVYNDMVRLSCCVLLYEVKATGANTAADAAVLVGSAGTQITSSVVIDPNGSNYISKQLLFLATQYSRYRALKMTFHYVPIGGNTSVNYNIRVASDSDPQHPNITGTPTAAKLLALSNTAEAPWWVPIRCEVPMLDRMWKYTSDGTSVNRETGCAILSVTSPTGLNTGSPAGFLYGEFVMDFADANISASTVSIGNGLSDDSTVRRKQLAQIQYRQLLSDAGAPEAKAVPPEWDIVDPMGRVVEYVTPHVERRAEPISPTPSESVRRSVSTGPRPTNR